MMSDNEREDKRLDAHEVSGQAAALAAHLRRSGVHWLPTPNRENVDALSDSFAEAPADVSPEAGAAAIHESTGVPEQRVIEPTAPVAATSEVAPAPPAPLRPASRVQPVAPVAAGEGAYPTAAIPAEQRQGELDAINQEVAACTRCEILSSCRTKTVFGEGNAAPRVAFFGEGPGADEDRSGRPFVGKAGQLLTKMIEACTFQREDVYILNTVKCRPPGNRNPEPDEIENCRAYYERQLAILRPEYIVCLGAVSAQELLKSKLSVGRLRGKLHQYFESKVLVTYHPAYLLRNPAAKKAAWADLQLLLRDAGIQV